MAVEDWTADEQHFGVVKAFYGLDDFEADEYVERDTLSFDFGGLSLGAAESESAEGTQGDSLAHAKNLLQQDRDPLGIADSEYRREAKLNPTTISQTSPAFDAKQFLARVHAQTTIADLRAGRAHLLKEIELRDAGIREMVRQNFSRFVFAKNNIDQVYGDMKAKGVADPTNPTFGTKRTTDKVAEAYNQALRIFQPLVRRTEQEAEMKRRLDFLRRYKATVFSVGKRLREAWQSGDYAAAVHDYKRGKLVVEQDGDQEPALRLFWRGQVEPEAERLRQAILSLLVGDQAGWQPSFDNHYRLIAMYKVLDPSSDPMRLWIDDYGARLLRELDTHFEQALEAVQALQRSWKDEYMGASLEGGLVRSLLALLVGSGKGRALGEWLPRLDFMCCALWTEKQVYFDGFGVILTRLLTILAESDISNAQVDQLCDAFKRTVNDHLDRLLLSDTNTIDSAIVAFNGAFKAASALSRPIQQHHTAGPLLIVSQDVLVQVARAALKHAWQLAPMECRRVARCQDWSIDQGDFSTAVMRSLETVMLHYGAETGRIMELLRVTLIGRQLTPKDNPIVGLERSVHACLDAFLEEMKRIVIGHQDPSSVEHTEHDRYTLPQVASSYKFLLSLANLQYFRQHAVNKLTTAYGELLGNHVADVLKAVQRSLHSMEHAITKTYLGEKQLRLNSIISGGMFYAGKQDGERVKPRPYIYQLLSLLSAIQTEIMDVSRGLMRVLMGELILGIFSHYLASIRASDPLQHDSASYTVLDAEVAVLEDILATGMSEEANELSQSCHTSISQLLDGKATTGTVQKAVRFHSATIVKQFASFQYT